MNCYLSEARVSYSEHIKIINPNSDLVVNGSLITDEIIAQILERISKVWYLKSIWFDENI